MPRFSDQKLQAFYDEFSAHQEAFEMHRQEQQELHNELLQSHLKMLAGIDENTRAVASLAEKTESIIEVWTASQGAFKVLRWIGQGLKWAAGTAIAAGGIWYYFKGGPK